MSSQREAVLGLSRLHDSRTEVPKRFAQGTPDGFGDRLFVFNGEGPPAWEALRLRRDFAAAPGVTAALHGRLEQLAGFEHPSFSAVRVVDDPGEPGGFLVMSAYRRGRRLAELERARSAAFAMTLIRDLTASLVALQSRGGRVTHGSLTAERILVTPEGRLIVRDHALGAVLDALALPATKMWSDLGVLRPPRQLVSARQLDVIHVAVVALASVVGRSIGPADYAYKLEELIHRHVLFPPLRRWLEAAFELSGTRLACAEEAQEAIVELFPAGLPGESEIRVSLAVFGRKTVEPQSTPHPLGLKHFLQDEGGTAFLPVPPGPAPLPQRR